MRRHASTTRRGTKSKTSALKFILAGITSLLPLFPHEVFDGLLRNARTKSATVLIYSELRKNLQQFEVHQGALSRQKDFIENDLAALQSAKKVSESESDVRAFEQAIRRLYATFGTAPYLPPVRGVDAILEARPQVIDISLKLNSRAWDSAKIANVLPHLPWLQINGFAQTYSAQSNFIDAEQAMQRQQNDFMAKFPVCPQVECEIHLNQAELESALQSVRELQGQQENLLELAQELNADYYQVLRDSPE